MMHMHDAAWLPTIYGVGYFKQFEKDMTRLKGYHLHYIVVLFTDIKPLIFDIVILMPDIDSYLNL